MKEIAFKVAERFSLALVSCLALITLSLISSESLTAQENAEENFLNAQVEQMRHYENKLIQITTGSIGLAFTAVFVIVTFNYLSLRNERESLRHELKTEIDALKKELENSQANAEKRILDDAKAKAKEEAVLASSRSLNSIENKITDSMRLHYDFIEFKLKFLEEKESSQSWSLDHEKFRVIMEKIALLCPNGNLKKGIYGSWGEGFLADSLEKIEVILSSEENNEAISLEDKMLLLQKMSDMPSQFAPLRKRIESIVTKI
ncbi:hypothetical protein IQ273_22670 [Nodosilinea sp. LEGE 07298]|uniref:hypothetical protein n=1 Tax=Nodosilinea sp. LEGE 07298 TaxID=2777970 RepID=UPI001880F9C5|nr:hypothetical protein [Nodosilinea sp. LEGE 07298]MBE9112213.1 hypothetical protein [Nodosilinea sp. LEGE 07298]